MKKSKLLAVVLLTLVMLASACSFACITPDHDHYFKYSVTQEPHCNKAGVLFGVCSCGETNTKVIPALEHEFKNGVCEICGEKDPSFHQHDWQNATCTEPKTCSDCGETEGEALGHTEVVDSAVEATCTESGLTEGSHCSVCEEVLVAQSVVNALGHTEVVDSAVVPTCTATGLTEGKHCLVCNEVLVAQSVVNALGHTEVIDSAVAPTCTATGLTEGKHCSVCNEVLVAQTVVDALGHTGVIDKAVAPTCVNTGLTEGKHCSVCNEVLVEQTFVEALGHTEVIDNAVAPTCTATGLTEGKHCSVCKEVLVAQTVVDALGHTEVVDQAVAPDCENTGLTQGSHCSVCEEILVEQEVVGALGHTPASAVTENNVEADCVNDGSYDSVVYCSVCDEELSRETIIVDALGHTEVIDQAVAPDCVNTGLTQGKHCSVCNEVLVEQTVVNALGHTEVIDNAVAPTCTATGLTEGKHCLVCNEVLVEQTVVNALGHTEVIDSAVAPTCTATGLTEGKHCLVCNEVLVEQTVVEALGHTYMNGNCSRCGVTSTEYFTFTLLSDDTYAIKAKDVNNIPANIVIPDSYKGKPVTSIGSFAFDYCDSLTSVVIPDSVTSIGESAFRHCGSLTSVVIGDSVTSIGESAFDYCDSLTSVVIPDSVTSIGSFAFRGCSGLTSVEIGNSVTSIGVRAFSNCNKLVEVVNKSSHITVTKGSSSNGYVGYYALSVSNCDNTYVSKLTNDNGYIIYTDGAEKILVGYTGTETALTLPAYVTKIYQCAFYNCDSLTSVVIGDSVTSIGDDAFYKCSSLTSVEIPNSVTSIGSSAFNSCSNLTSIEIPNSVTSIGGHAFYNCSNLTSVEIPDSVTSIGNSAFGGCSSLQSITIPFVGAVAGKTSSDTYQYPFGYIFGTSSYTGATATEQYYYGSSTSSTTYSYYYIPTSLKQVTVTGGNILYGAFDDCRSLTSVVIGDSVTSIGDSAFRGCSSLTSVEIPDSVTSIGDRAFYGCYNLTSVVIGDSVTSIGSYAFKYCSNLTSIEIPDSVTSIGRSAFEDCSSLTSVEIGASVISIGSWAFDGCSLLTSVVIGDSVTSIGKDAFYNCSSLTEVNYLGTIDQWAEIEFDGCYANPLYYAKQLKINGEVVTEVNLTSATKVSKYSFCNYDNLTSVVIGDSVTSIGEYAFGGCSSLSEVYYKGDAEGWKNITIGYWNSNLTNATRYYYSESQPAENGNYWHYNENGEIEIWQELTPNSYFDFTLLSDGNYSVSAKDKNNMPSSVNIPSSYNGANVVAIAANGFYNCKQITSITLPSTLKWIYEYGFYGCTGLTDIKIPNGVTYIDRTAFFSTSLLETVGGISYVKNFALACSTASQTMSFRDGTEYIAASILKDAIQVKTIYLPKTLKTIGASAFSRCEKLTKIVYDGTMEEWKAVSKGTNWCYITSCYTVVCSDGTVSI